MQPDGNLVCARADASASFATNTGGHPGAFLELRVADGNLYAWSSSSTLTTAPVGSAQVGSSTFVAVDLATGQQRWQTILDGRPTVRTAGFGRVLFADGNQRLHLADAVSGRELWEPEPQRHDVNGLYTIAADALYVGWRCGGD